MRDKKEQNIEIGRRIKDARQKAKMTQELLAEKIDVSTQYISDLERGLVGISLQTLKAVCVTLCVSSDSILFGETISASEAIMAAKCKTLSPEQMQLISGIIDNFRKL